MAEQRNLCGKPKEKAFFEKFGDPITITANVLVDMFAKFYNPETKKEEIEYYPDDLITVTDKEFPGVKPTVTTCGIYITNKVIMEDLKVCGYVNKTFNKKVIGKIADVVAKALLADDITLEQCFHFIDSQQWLFGGKVAHVINPSLSENILSLPEPAKKLRSDMFKQYHKELTVDNDPMVSSMIEKAVTDKALETLRKGDDPAMAIFDSGCGVDPYNNYKVMFVMKGPIADNTGLYTSGYKVATGNYDDGLSMADQSKVADNLVTSSYASGVKTQEGGYSAKKYNATLQNVRLGPRGSDCKTTETAEVTITDKNASEWGNYHFMMEKDEPVLLTPKNIKNYIGKTVKMRVPDGCKYKNNCYCNVCFGDRAYRIDTTNIGLTMNIACGAMMNASLKTKHDTTVKPYTITVEDLLMFA